MKVHLQELSSVKVIIDKVKEIDDLKKKNAQLKKDINFMKDRTPKNDRKFEKYSLIFYGIVHGIEDANVLLDLINIKFELVCKFHDIRDFHRIGSYNPNTKNPNLLRIEFVHFKLVQSILGNQSFLKALRIFISKDYIPVDYQAPKLLYILQMSKSP
ncbi:unnamed protein product [Psylliodes chrysocephalus]|uniref:Uncharacterized protein n=1 Tax=Psylliodes chrysocephalus TaxID=3402493 RepID=A0A9P0CGN9_9CUCU|nr:unnamed protein product [Psylliodes chrysocephala]